MSILFTFQPKKKIYTHLKKNNIKIIAIQSIFFGIKEIDPKNISLIYLIDHFKKMVEFASFFSIKNISLGSCPSRKIHIDNKVLDNINFDLMNYFSIIAGKKNININIEPISKKYGNKFLCRPYDTINFIKKLKKNNVKLLLDTGNLHENKINFEDFYFEYKKIIGHIHISNKNIKLLNSKLVNEKIKFLKRIGYKKSLTIEYISKKKNIINKLSNIVKSI